MTDLDEHQMAIKEAQHKGWMIGYTEAWNNATNGDLPSHPPLDDAGNPWLEEPIEFASVVREKTGMLFVRTGALLPQPWESGAESRKWSDLDHPEVLRVGIGEPVSTDAHDAAYVKGREDFAGAAREEIEHLRAVLITGPERRVADTALALVAALLGES